MTPIVRDQLIFEHISLRSPPGYNEYIKYKIDKLRDRFPELKTKIGPVIDGNSELGEDDKAWMFKDYVPSADELRYCIDCMYEVDTLLNLYKFKTPDWNRTQK